MKNARVIIVDDESDIREGLQDWLSRDYLVRTFDSAESFLSAFNDFEFEDGIPSCILLDFQMPGMTGVELQTNLKLMNVAFPIIFMSGNAHQADIIDAWHGGAIDFMLKPFTANQVSDKLASLFDSTHANSEVTSRGIGNEKIIDIPISQREAQVLLLLGQGHQQNEVAQMLGLSLRTVKMYRTFLKNKLNLNTLMELARYHDEHRQSILRIVEGT
jgi:FixJ family two-component response regulator